jgi:hypothetical protein
MPLTVTFSSAEAAEVASALLGHRNHLRGLRLRAAQAPVTGLCPTLIDAMNATQVILDRCLNLTELSLVKLGKAAELRNEEAKAAAAAEKGPEVEVQ